MIKINNIIRAVDIRNIRVNVFKNTLYIITRMFFNNSVKLTKNIEKSQNHIELVEFRFNLQPKHILLNLKINMLKEL